MLSLAAHLKLRRVGDLGNGLNDVPHNLSCLSFCDDTKQRPQLREKLSERLCVLLLHVNVAEALNSLQSTQNFRPDGKAFCVGEDGFMWSAVIA